MNKTSIFFFFLLALACSKEEISSRQYPRINTVGVTDITSIGAVFHGEVTFSSVEILDYGFLWTDLGFPQLDNVNSDKISMGPKVGTGFFDATVDRSLKAGVTYSMRAFARSADHVVYGKIIDFVSQGSLAIVLEDFEPKEGTWGDTVLIKGKHFGPKSKVKFDDAEAKVLEANGDQMKAVVPPEFMGPEKKISVSFSGNTLTSVQTFKLKSPVIDDFNPKRGAYNDLITLTGKYFHLSKIVVMFDDISAALFTKSNTSLSFKVPTGLPPGNTSLKVISGVQEVVSLIPFFSESPNIIEIDPVAGTYGDIITIKGNYFGSAANANVVKFNNFTAVVITASPSEITAKVPDEIDVPVSKITVLYNQQISAPVDFNLEPPFATNFSPNRGSTGTQITITGGRFSPVANNNSVKIGGVTATMVSSSTSQIVATIPADIISHELQVKVMASGDSVIVPGLIKTPYALVSTFPGTKPAGSIVIQGRTFVFGNSNQFFEFESASKTWTRKSDFPGGIGNLDIPIFAFSSAGKGYAGLSYYSTAAFWEYDPATDSWTQKNDVPFATNGNFGFNLADQGYVFGTSGPQFWKYDATTDTWAQKTDPGFYAYYFFVIGNDAFAFENVPNYANGNLWKYNDTDGWSKVGIGPLSNFDLSTFFSINTKGYAISTSGKVWEFSPQSASWSSMLDYGGPLSRAVFQSANKAYIIGSSIWEFDPAY